MEKVCSLGVEVDCLKIMKLFCQILILIVWIIQFFASLRSDFVGSKAQAPHGFFGAIVTVLLIGLVVLVHIGAGAFSEIVNLFK